MRTTYHHFESVDSTNTWAKRNTAHFPRGEITVITADQQTKGRGRLSRAWISPPSQNLYVTFCFFLSSKRSDIGNTPQVLSISVAEMLEELGFSPGLKWPNDIILSKKKVAGILCETSPCSDALCIILGLGLNINMTAKELEQVGRPATSLFVESGARFVVSSVLTLLEKKLYPQLKTFVEDGFSPLFHSYEKRLLHAPGDKVQFHDTQKVREGKFHSLAPDGTLNLLLEDGQVQNFPAGEFVSI